MRERDILKLIYAHNAELLADGAADHPRARVLIPPGDDMAALELSSHVLLAAADQVIEGRHFTSTTDWLAVGRKAVLRNVSDVAAMACRPVACLATAALPAHAAPDRIARLYDGLRTAARDCGCPLIGGDTGFHASLGEGGAPLVVSVTILAAPGASGRIVQRQGARVGDWLCVTGHLGGSLQPDGGGRHLAPEPRVEHAAALLDALGERLHAMVDLSDGLGRDAGHLARAAGLAVEIDATALPCSPGCSWQHAVADGEDYELAFACQGDPPREVLGVPVGAVGRFVAAGSQGGQGDGAGAVWVLSNGRRVDVSQAGWEHTSGDAASTGWGAVG